MVPVQKLACRDEVASAVKKAGFSSYKVEKKEYRLRFKDMFDIIRWIKGVGANSLRRDVFVGRKLLNSANKFYLENFRDSDGVFATLEVVWGEASK